MSCRRVAPSESRTAISVVRFAARASSRLAMLAQAMSSTMPVTAKSSVSGSRDAVMAELWPLRPSLSVMTWARNRAAVWAPRPLIRGASTSLMIA